MKQIHNFYIGYDNREDIVYQTARSSLLYHNPETVNVIPLIQDNLRANRIYTRPKDLLAATDFSLTRFLTPILYNDSHYKYIDAFSKYCFFVDCDFLFTKDLSELYEEINDNPQYAVYCVKHDYTPLDVQKMAGQRQYKYPRKNWSSFMVFNTRHEVFRNTQKFIDMVNTASPAYLHQFKWIDDDAIYGLDKKYNFLVGEYLAPDQLPELIQQPTDKTPHCIHYTLGVGVFENYSCVDYHLLWQQYSERTK